MLNAIASDFHIRVANEKDAKLEMISGHYVATYSLLLQTFGSMNCFFQYAAKRTIIPHSIR